MHRKLIVSIAMLVVILILLNFNFLLRGISGFVTLTEQAIISLSVSNLTEGRIIYFLYPSYMIEDDPASFIVNFKNIGNQNLTGRIEIHIDDSANHTIESLYDDNFILAPLEIDSFFTTWVPYESGTYYVSARVPYDGKTAEENRTIKVIPLELPPPSPTVTTIPTEIPAIINLTLDYVKIVNITQGGSSLIDVRAFNLGNTDLHNLSLSATSEELELILDVHPKEISVLEAQSSTIFLISVQVPVDAAVKEHSINFSVSSEEVTETGEITVNVLLLEICAEIEQSIENYVSLIDTIVIEVQKAVAEGRNVTLVLNYLDKAKKEFDIAKEIFESNNCEAAKLRLENVRAYLEKTIVELARTIKPPKLPLIPPECMPFINILLIILILLLILLLFACKRKKKKKKKKRKRKRKRKSRKR